VEVFDETLKQVVLKKDIKVAAITHIKRQLVLHLL